MRRLMPTALDSHLSKGVPVRISAGVDALNRNPLKFSEIRNMEVRNAALIDEVFNIFELREAVRRFTGRFDIRIAKQIGIRWHPAPLSGF